MFEAQNKIIIVDNDSGHLSTLSSKFQKKGIGCRALEYDVLFSTPLRGVRVAFFDINLQDTGGGEGRIFNTLADSIKSYIHIDNGPFALVFWTSNHQMIEDFKEYVEQRHKDCPKPFVVSYIDKDVFMEASDEDLEAEIFRILSDDILQLMFDFEKISDLSSYRVIEEIYKIIPSKDTWGINSNFTENFEKVFSKISTSTLGFHAAKENPDNAVYEALMPMLSYQISNNINSEKWRNFLVTLNNANVPKDLSNPNDFKESTLNSIFHIDVLSDNKDKRGVVLKLSKNHFKVTQAFGMSYRSWILDFMKFNQSTALQTSYFENIVKKSELLLIEISSACDFQQKKPRLNKYVYAIKTPPNSQKFQTTEAALRVGKFNLDNDEFEIWINMNFVLGIKPSNILITEALHLFTFKKEIMDMIGNRYANHVSRIGITSF